MILKPKLPYKGLTVIMSNASRFDRAELLSANGGYFFRNECLRPHLNVMQIEVRTKEEKQPFLPNTKVVLLLGKDAYTEWTGDKEHSLGEVRGSIYYVNGIPSIPSYLPQDCVDNKDYESTHNELLIRKDYTEDTGAAPESAKAEKRRHGVTARTNWGFWLQKDTEKAISILLNEGQIPEQKGWFKPTYILYPSAQEVIKELEETKNKCLYLDLETDENFGLKCIGYSLDNERISVVPIIDYNYKRAYPEVPEILRAFCIAAENNTVVSHNGAGFDWMVLPWKYGMPFGKKFYDTMLAAHRCFPAAEKSLGHCTSLWTYEPFHKDEGSMQYATMGDMRQLMNYCGKDVYTMMLIKRAIDSYAVTVPGLTASIQQAMDAIPVYRLMTLQGISFDTKLRDAQMADNDGMMNEYIRIANWFIGEETQAALKSKGNTSLLASNTKCVHYFHNMLDYPVVARSKVTGNASLAKGAMFKLKLKHENPVIDLVLAYRDMAKESGSLKFDLWKE